MESQDAPDYIPIDMQYEILSHWPYSKLVAGKEISVPIFSIKIDREFPGKLKDKPHGMSLDTYYRQLLLSTSHTDTYAFKKGIVTLLTSTIISVRISQSINLFKLDEGKPFMTYFLHGKAVNMELYFNGNIYIFFDNYVHIVDLTGQLVRVLDLKYGYGYILHNKLYITTAQTVNIIDADGTLTLVNINYHILYMVECGKNLMVLLNSPCGSIIITNKQLSELHAYDYAITDNQLAYVDNHVCFVTIKGIVTMNIYTNVEHIYRYITSVPRLYAWRGFLACVEMDTAYLLKLGNSEPVISIKFLGVSVDAYLIGDALCIRVFDINLNEHSLVVWYLNSRWQELYNVY